MDKIKLSIIQSVYSRNPYIAESNRINLAALDEVGVSYEYIICNDKGDPAIKEDLGDILKHPRVVYVYSDTNFGHGVCSGGWLGGIPHMHGELVHFANQDDVYSPLFYRLSLKAHEDASVMMTHTNAFMVNGDLTVKSLMLNPDLSIDYYYTDPFFCFRDWFGVGEHGRNEVTRANNGVLAPSVIYKRVLHDLIGLPDTEAFGGACDFEYWARILFYGYRCRFLSQPLWLYRTSPYSTSNTVKDTETLFKLWNGKIKEKYSKLYKEKTHV